MSIEADTYTFLSNQAGITNIVGTRIYPSHLPQNPTYPAMLYTLISADHITSLDDSVGMVRARVQFDVYSPSMANVVNTIEQLRQSLQKYSGSYGAGTCLTAKLINDFLAVEKPADGSSNWLHRKSADYLITLRE
ncbi:hypothetical protein [Thalassoglobus sp.]|uniref:tail completion protein gp17 n=1 Tax=Thalassoglobus sp. TaxID=2795869 RepID=UPI003AA861DD